MTISSLPPPRMRDLMQCNSSTSTHFRWNPVHLTYADDLARSRLTCALGSNGALTIPAAKQCFSFLYNTESLFVCSQCHDESSPVFIVFRSARPRHRAPSLHAHHDVVVTSRARHYNLRFRRQNLVLSSTFTAGYPVRWHEGNPSGQHELHRQAHAHP